MTDEELELFPTSESASKMLSYVTQDFYAKSYVGKWIFQVMGLEYDDMQTLVEELPDQFFPETATWGLKYHELKWGLPIRENLSYEERRRLIYQKRDYRAPMTPYRMENTLKDATGFDVSVADVHDAGDLNYEPEHPNVFKVYFMGDGTLDTATALKVLDEIKQSHTTYSINQYTAISLDCTTLEEFTNFILRMALAINFWDSPMLNGAYYLDGSLLLDTYRRYDMKVGLKYEQGDFVVSEDMNLVKMLMRLATETDEAFGGSTAMIIGNVIKFYSCLQLDGEVLLDGSVLLDVIRQEIPMTLSMATDIPIAEEYGNATVTMTRNLAYLNGSKKLNGATLLNSYQGKEDL